MPRYVMVATANAQPGQEAEYKSWYETYHLPEICAVPGVVSGRRLEAVDSIVSQPKMRYVTIYELETDHPNSVMAEIIRRTKDGEMTPTKAIDREGANVYFYQQIEGVGIRPDLLSRAMRRRPRGFFSADKCRMFA